MKFYPQIILYVENPLDHHGDGKTKILKENKSIKYQSPKFNGCRFLFLNLNNVRWMKNVELQNSWWNTYGE